MLTFETHTKELEFLKEVREPKGETGVSRERSQRK